MLCAKPVTSDVLVPVIKALLGSHPGGAAVPDADGMLPIHLICAQVDHPPATGILPGMSRRLKRLPMNHGPNIPTLVALLDGLDGVQA